jgi:hypothetical protein
MTAAPHKVEVSLYPFSQKVRNTALKNNVVIFIQKCRTTGMLDKIMQHRLNSFTPKTFHRNVMTALGANAVAQRNPKLFFL